MILFSILNNKKKLKKLKRGRGARVDATWHAGPAQRLRGAYILLY